MWAANEEALAVFMRCQTQWRVVPMGGFLGLDYPGVEVVMRRMHVKNKDAVFDELCMMEFAALPVRNGKNDV